MCLLSSQLFVEVACLYIASYPGLGSRLVHTLTSDQFHVFSFPLLQGNEDVSGDFYVKENQNGSIQFESVAFPGKYVYISQREGNRTGKLCEFSVYQLVGSFLACDFTLHGCDSAWSVQQDLNSSYSQGGSRTIPRYRTVTVFNVHAMVFHTKYQKCIVNGGWMWMICWFVEKSWLAILFFMQVCSELKLLLFYKHLYSSIVSSIVNIIVGYMLSLWLQNAANTGGANWWELLLNLLVCTSIGQHVRFSVYSSEVINFTRISPSPKQNMYQPPTQDSIATKKVIMTFSCSK